MSKPMRECTVKNYLYSVVHLHLTGHDCAPYCFTSKFLGLEDT